MKIVLILTLGLCGLLASSARAQSVPQSQAEAPRREGLTVSVGFGAGSARTYCEACAAVRSSAPAGYVRVGYAYRPDVILAWEINGWTKSRAEEGASGSISIGTGTALLQWYPNVSRGLFLSGGVGVGGLDLEYSDPGKLDISDGSMAFGYQIGAGYDLRVRPNFSLTPFVTYFASAGATFRGSGLKADGNVMALGLGATWH